MKSKQILALALANLSLVGMYLSFEYVPAGSRIVASAVESIQAEKPLEEFRVVQALPFGDLDPQVFAPQDRAAISLVYEPLIRFDALLQPEPALAASWFYRDPMHLVVRLRSGAVFHDGSAVTCRDVAASFDRIRRLENAPAKNLANKVSVAVENDTTCVFELTEPDFNLARKLTQAFIIPAEFAEKTDAFDAAAVPGTGRYVLADRAEQLLTFRKFTEFYAADPLDPLQIQLAVEPKKYNRLGLLKAEKTDLLLDLPSSFAEQAETRLGFAVEPSPALESVFILFNHKSPAFGSAADRARLAAAIRSLDLAAQLKDSSLSDQSQLLPSGVFGFDPSLLDAPAAAEPAADKLFVSVAVSPENVLLAQALQAELAKLGIDLSIRQLAGDELLAAMRAGSADAFILGWRFDLGIADEFFASLTRGEFAAGLGLRDPVRAELLESALAEFDPAQRLAKLQKLERSLTLDDPVGAPLVGLSRLSAAATAVRVPFATRFDGLLIPTHD